jgi:adenylate cyclase
MAEIRVRNESGVQAHVLGEVATIGRSQTCNVQLNDGYVSKVHSMVTRRGSEYFIRDLKSANRTRINGAVIEQETRLRDGDEVVFGNTVATFVDAEEARQHAAPPVAAGVRAPDPGSQTMLGGASIESRLAATADNFQAEALISSDQALRREYEKLRASFELSSAVAGELEPQAVLVRILDTLIRLFGADRGVVLGSGTGPAGAAGAGGELEVRCGRDAAGAAADVPYSRTIAAEALASRSALLSFDASIDERFKAAESVMLQGIRSSMAAPMLRGEHTLGVIVLYSRFRSGVFTEKDLRILTTAANQAAIALHNAQLAQQLAAEAVVRQRFERLVAPSLVERIVSGAMAVERKGELRDVTVLFSDIRGFTSFSERQQPQEIVRLLNDYFEEMVDIIFRNEGTLDKFVGDEIMALFGAPVGHADDALRAVRTAVEMQQAIRALQARWPAGAPYPFQVGIGINSGDVVAGFIGSSKALDYTVIGDVVNTASRLCGQALPGEILVGEPVVQRLRDHGFGIRPGAPLSVKGKADPLPVYRVDVS